MESKTPQADGEGEILGDLTLYIQKVKEKIKKEENESKARMKAEQEKARLEIESEKGQLKESEKKLELEKEKFAEFMIKEKEQYKNIATLKEKIEKSAAAAKGYCRLNVGGKIFEVSLETIKAKDSLFYGLMGEQILGNSKEAYFLDKDPILFEKILKYMRTGYLDIETADAGTLKILMKEFEFFGLEFPKSAQIIAHSAKDDTVPVDVIEKKLKSIIEVQNMKEVIVPKPEIAVQHSPNCNSVLLSIADQHALANWICPEHPETIELVLLYRGSVDGFSTQKFHSACDGHSPTVSVIQSDQKYLFGGYTTQAWNSSGSYASDSNSFVYSLTKKYKANVSPNYVGNAIYNNSNYGPTYGGGHTIHICNNCNQSNSNYTRYNGAYYLHPYTGYNLFYLSGTNNFYVYEIEVFEVKKVEKSKLFSVLPNYSVLCGIQELYMLKCWIKPKAPDSISLELLFRGSKDGYSAITFHSKCNGKGPIIMVMISHIGEIFGGYTSVSLSSSGSNITDSSAFLFSLSKKAKFNVNPSYTVNAVFDHASSYFIQFGGNPDLRISDNCNQNNSSYSNCATYFQYPAGINAESFLAGSQNFCIHEIEVFQVKNL